MPRPDAVLHPVSHHAISEIGNAPDSLTAFGLYALHHEHLADWKFVLRDDKGTLPSHSVHREFAHGAAVCTPFGSAPVFLLDRAIYRDMLAGPAHFHFDFSISLDTQAVSYLDALTQGRDVARINPDLQEVFEFIARPDVNVDPLPYLLENIDKAGRSDRVDQKIHDKLRAYEVLRTLDLEALQAHGEVRSQLDDSALRSQADKHMAFLLEQARDARFLSGLARQYQFVYACLLKMAVMHASRQARTLGQQVLDFSQFCHDVLATMAGRELVLARHLLGSDKPVAFFDKLASRRIDVLRNMAWDLLHVRRMEQHFGLDTDDRASFFFPSLLTFDKGLTEIIDLYPLRAVACHVAQAGAIPFFAGDWREQIGDSRAERDAYIARFLSVSAQMERASRMEQAKQAVPRWIARTEQALVDELGFGGGTSRSIATYPEGWD